MTATGALILQALVAVRAKQVVVLDWVTAVGAVAVVHELTLLESYLELLLLVVDLHQRRTEQHVSDNTDYWDQSDDGPESPNRATTVSVASNPNDAEYVKSNDAANDSSQDELKLGGPHLGKKFTHS